MHRSVSFKIAWKTTDSGDSMMGELSDKASSTNVTDLTADLAAKATSNAIQIAFSTIFALMGDEGDKSKVKGDLGQLQELHQLAVLRGGNIEFSELRNIVKQVFAIHDNLKRWLEEALKEFEKVQVVAERIMGSLNVLCLALIEPILTPILLSVKEMLHKTSGSIIDNASQTEVFNEPKARLVQNRKCRCQS